jgi:stage II sporulation protein D
VEARQLPGFEWCYEWRRTVSSEALVTRLGAGAMGLGAVKKLVVVRRNRAGRVAALRVVGAHRSVDVVGPPAVRAALDAPSARFEVLRSPEGFVLHGWGYGDGVGLSQHGALGMARAGYNCESILAHYYRDVELTRDYGVGQSRPLRASAPSARQVTASGRGPS